jgi:amino acid adenylation domain-containing protein
MPGLKTDYPRPLNYATEASSIDLTLPEHVSKQLSKLTGDSAFLTYTTLLAVLKVCLYKHTDSNAIVVGSPARRQKEGMPETPVNALAIAVEVGGEMTFRNLLMNVRETLVQAYAKQNYPYERIVRDLGLEKVENKCPLFDVVMVFRGIHGELPALKHDLTLTFEKTPEGVSGRIDFNGKLFRRESLERFAGHFIRALDSATGNVERPVRDIEILTEAERRRILVEWNDTHTAPLPARRIHELFEAQVERAPDATAVVFGEARLTYRELDERANRLARYLRTLDVGAEVLVGICLERSVEMVVALLGILKAGGAYLPLDPSYPQERLTFMAEDARLNVLLTEEKLASLLSQTIPHVVKLDSQWEMIEPLDGGRLHGTGAAHNLAYVIYTSGSTGRPKGVLVQHHGLCNMIEAQTRDFKVDAQSRVLQFASSGFDASVSEIFMALTVGASLHLERAAVLSSPDALARLMRQQSITTVTLPPAMLAVLSESGLTELQTLITAGEHCSAEIANRWSNGRRFFNAYGPTETTVCATMHLYRDKHTVAPPIGRPIANTEVYVLDRHLNPVPVGVAGELYIGGDGLARGYLNRAELTAERFIPHPFATEAGARLYRTGDLVRYLPDGNLEFIGRIDTQVKVRGYRIELGEIEAVLLSHPAVRSAVVVAREEEAGDKRLVAYVVGETESVAVIELRAYLKEKLPEYMMPSAFVMLDALPLTANGKVDRRALPAPERGRAEGGNEYVAPRTPVEEMVAGIWSEVLGVERVGVNDNFFELGGHSLLATQVISRLKESLRVEVTLDKMFESPTVAAVAAVVETAQQTAQGSDMALIPRAARDRNLPLSFAQQRLWFIDQLEPNSPFYNVSAAIRLKGKLDVGALEQTLNEIVRRHETLRTTFASVEGQPVQIIAPSMELKLSVVDLQHVAEDERDTAAQRLAVDEAKLPFDLSHGPLLRVTLLRLGAQEHIALLTMHHIVSDGWSMGVLIREVAACYESFSTNKPALLPELPIQYADFAVWQRERLQGDALEEQLDYWRRKLSDLPRLALPTDRPRPDIQSVRGAYQVVPLPADLSASVRSLGQQEGVTVFMTLLAAFQTLLYRYTGQQDIVVGTDVANRTRVETEGLIGIFVNHLVMRTDLSGRPTFRELLGRVRAVSLGAYAHQDLPFDMLVKALKPKRDLGHTPLFQVLFVVQNAPMPELNLSGLTLSVVEADNETTKFDLALFIVEAGDELTGIWKFNSDLFDPSTILRMSKNFESLLSGIVANREATLEELIEKVNEAEKLREAADKNERRQAKLKKLGTVKRRTIDLGEVKLVETSQFSPDQPLPLVCQPSSPDLDPLAWARARRPFIQQQLATHGGLLFRRFPLPSTSHFEQFASALCPSLFGDYGDLPRASSSSGKVYGSTPYPPDQAILFHNESSHLERWPMKIFFYCVQPARRGGTTPITDCRKVWRLLAPEVRERLRREGLIYVRNYAPGLDVSWQDFFRTTERGEVEARLRAAGVEWEWTGGGEGLRVRQRSQAAARHPQTGEEVFFNQIQLHHVSSLAGEVRRSLEEVFGEEELPRNVYYGSGERIEEEVMAEVGRAYEAAAVDFEWEQGDVVMLDNMLVAHGRRAYEGERKIVVAMGEMVESKDIETRW